MYGLASIHNCHLLIKQIQNIKIKPTEKEYLTSNTDLYTTWLGFNMKLPAMREIQVQPQSLTAS